MGIWKLRIRWLFLLSADALSINRVVPNQVHTSMNEPCLVEELLTLEKCETWRRHILTRSKQERVNMLSSSEGSDYYESLQLGDAIDAVLLGSGHSNPLYCQSYGNSCSTDQLGLYDLIQDVYQDEDVFPFINMNVPIYDSLMFSGKHSSSTLMQCHPYPTFFLCLDGNQLWRILPPSTALGNSTENIMAKAWEDYHISVGRQSSLSLFGFISPDMECNKNDDMAKLHDFGIIADSEEMLRPNFSPNKHHYAGVLVQGDLLVIPPGWYAQSYNLEPSLTIGSHRCGVEVDLQHFLRHVEETAGIEENGVDFGGEQNAKSSIDGLFERLEQKYEISSSNWSY